MAKLHIVGPEGEISVSLEDWFTIGRLPENSLSLPNDKAVSREHARIERSSSRYLLHDLGSANGTFVERGEQKTRVVEPFALQPGDVIHIGRTRVRFDPSDEVGDAADQREGEKTIVPGATIVGRILPTPRRSGP